MSGLIYMTERKHVMTEPVVGEEPTASTPEPVVKAAAIWGSLWTALATGIGLLATFGVLSGEQVAILNQLGSLVTANIVPVGIAVVGIVSAVSGLGAAGVTAAVARRHVRPVPPAQVGNKAVRR
jgi:hypothetical protein